MGKTKHKKHHRHEDGDGEEAGDDATNPGLKMVIIKTFIIYIKNNMYFLNIFLVCSEQTHKLVIFVC